MDKYLLGIDIGTTDIKVVMFSVSGEEISSSRQENRLIIPAEGCFEQDMNELWLSMVYVLKDLIKNSSINPEQIIGIGLCGQGEGAWLIDNNGQPVRHAILWNDTRSMSIVDSVDDKFRKRHKEITGSEPGPDGTNSILKWLSEHELESLERADCCFYCKDWIAYKLTGERSVEMTDMSASLLDLASSSISSEMFEMLDITQYQKLFPQIVNSHNIMGFVTDDVAKITGLIRGTPVAAGCMDVVATGIGVGAINDGDVCSILGTSCINGYVSSSFNAFQGSSAYLKHSDINKYYCLIGTMSGTPNMDWIFQSLFSDILEKYGKTRQFYNIVEENLSNKTIGSNGIVYHPYIRGERDPFLNINARASFFGITDKTDRWDMLYAIYEGLAYSIKDCFQSYEPKHLFLTGGGANSPILVQVISDCLGVPVTVSASKELGAKGAAISAGIAVGVFKNLADAVREFRVGSTTFEPRLKNTAIYQDFFNLYKKLQHVYFDAWEQRNLIINKLHLQQGEHL